MTERIYGGFWRRLVAFAIDMIALYLISLFLLLTALVALGLGGGLSLHRIAAFGELPRGMGLFTAVYAAVTFITGMAYFIWFHGSVGQTPGKMALGLRVIRTSGENMTFGLAFLRLVGTLVSTLFLFLGYLWIAFDGNKQGWHDKIAATLVIRTANDPSPAAPHPAAPLPETAITGRPPADPLRESAAPSPASPPLPPSDTEAPRP